MLEKLPFRHIIVADTEFNFGGHASAEDAARSGERPHPVCIVARDLRSGQEWRLWEGEFEPLPPFPIGPDSLFVAFYASAELGFFRALGWPMPANVLDLFVEFRNRTNGISTPASSGLVGALTFFGLDNIGVVEKDNMRSLVLRGGPWTDTERAAILDYCHGDVAALERLLPAMQPQIDLPRALLRGRYMKAAAAMEWHGVPIDTNALALLRQYWTEIQDQLIAAIDVDYGVFDSRSFKAERWESYLVTHDIPWPRLESGRLDLSDGAFRQMAKAYPQVSPMRELRSALSDLRLNDLAVGQDGRNRTILSALTLIGASKNLGSLPPCPAIAPCRMLINLATPISPSPNKLARCRKTPPKKRTGRCANCLSSACWPPNTAWNGKAWQHESASRRWWRGICCERTAKPIAISGGGRTRPWITLC